MTRARWTQVAAGVVAAVGLVAAAAMTHALVNRDWVGLETVFLWPLRLGVVVTIGLAAFLASGLLRRRRWARPATAVTFASLAVAAGMATVDTAQRTIGSASAPLWHMAAPSLLLSLALVVLIALVRSA